MFSKLVNYNSTKVGTEDCPELSFSFNETEELIQNYLKDNTLSNGNNPSFFRNNIYNNNELFDFDSYIYQNNIFNISYIENDNDQSKNMPKSEPIQKQDNKELIEYVSEPKPQKENKELNELESEQKPMIEIKILGRKKIDDITDRKHDKYKEDNMIRKIKVKLKDALLKFINSKIKESNFSFVINNVLYKGDEVRLLNIKNKNNNNINVDFIMKLFNTKIKYVLSDDINDRYKNYPINFNREIINKIYTSKNGGHIRNILDKTFLECLKYYRMDEDIFGDDSYSCLSGLQEGFQEFKKELSEDNDKKYEDGIIDLINKFEIVYSSKTPRKKRNKFE